MDDLRGARSGHRICMSNALPTELLGHAFKHTLNCTSFGRTIPLLGILHREA